MAKSRFSNLLGSITKSGNSIRGNVQEAMVIAFEELSEHGNADKVYRVYQTMERVGSLNHHQFQRCVESVANLKLGYTKAALTRKKVEGNDFAPTETDFCFKVAEKGKAWMRVDIADLPNWWEKAGSNASAPSAVKVELAKVAKAAAKQIGDAMDAANTKRVLADGVQHSQATKFYNELMELANKYAAG